MVESAAHDQAGHDKDEQIAGDRRLSKTMELLWGLVPEGGRGPRRGMSLEQIVGAAIELVDEEGFAALSMSKVAQRLGFTAMSLYRYVDSKATLIALAMDRVIGQPPQIPEGTPWREGLEQWAWAEYHALLAHPGWLEVPLKTPPLGPGNVAWLESGLAILSRTAVPEPIKMQLVTNLSIYVIGRARAVGEIAAGDQEDAGDWELLGQVIDPQRHPALTAIVQAQAFEQDEQSWEQLFFGFGLDRLLDGYEQLITSYT
ncbi:TetR/AcrR family transcriptional regulator [Nocardia donostiensis]|uniref:TetR family transcriptional regulator n=1 Tax=Nocardia donostiensis TaxID=1538463 RepID=A0A1V2TCW9_9NOCA|nr:TetR/AcrR family transcriptional regulator [Nocardia donostiensis]ONM47308.1 TetR family transcriptional regulator [Nocardia donostiensis]OQS21087.1 TetR family transcriptional regulator [Nocardia donostiensis]